MKHCRILGFMPSSTSVSNSFEVSETLYIHISGLTPSKILPSVVSPICDPRSHAPHLNLDQSLPPTILPVQDPFAESRDPPTRSPRCHRFFAGHGVLCLQKRA